jgi:hypothetical protein
MSEAHGPLGSESGNLEWLATFLGPPEVMLDLLTDVMQYFNAGLCRKGFDACVCGPDGSWRSAGAGWVSQA